MNDASLVRGDDPDLARNRIRFLTSERVEQGTVRDTIVASWQRSREFQVPADRIELPYVPDQDLETPLVRAAGPVLTRLGDTLGGQSISLILTDQTGLVLSRQSGDPDLNRHLESVELAPGFSYGERFVGTNGIGTALEEGRPTHVFGHEHYAENLENLACAGAPIRHPITGKTLGAVDFTCWRKDAGELLVVLARTAAEQIRQGLLAHTHDHELALFEGYLRACQRSTGAVIAFSDDLVMMNDRARKLLDAADQAVVLSHAEQALTTGDSTTTRVSLPTGGKARLHCRQLHSDRSDRLHGGVLHVDLIDADDVPSGAVVGGSPPMFLPGVVGSTPLWLRCCRDVDAAYARGEWVILAGEHGTGRYTLARCAQQRHQPTGRLRAVDADEGDGDWALRLQQELVDDPVDAFVIRNADRLSGDRLDAVTTVLEQMVNGHGEHAPWVALTLSKEATTDTRLAGLLALFPWTVHVPPLRQRSEDLRELVPLLLSKLGYGGRLTYSPAAMHLLMRASWPGNVAQLYDLLKDVARRRRAGTIRPTDLPAEYRVLNKRPLNRLESAERDAIVQSLDDAEGNKLRAATLLGISRATLYRKIHEYDIVLPSR
ncbi:MAG: GAF domain-containing protein [Streptosporangiales bacterium]|nr:GAF domain-containing protein [Streptosporangiales bacterium]